MRGLVLVLLAGCGPLINPAVAYNIERRDCRVNAHGDAEALRRCNAMVEHKYARYWSEGAYPPPVTSTPGPSYPR